MLFFKKIYLKVIIYNSITYKNTLYTFPKNNMLLYQKNCKSLKSTYLDSQMQYMEDFYNFLDNQFHNL